MANVARVLIDGASELVFDYAIDERMLVQAGCRVRVPLRRGDASGTVLSTYREDPSVQRGFQLRPISKLLSPEPVLSPALLRLAAWIAEYYATGIEGVIRVILPQVVRGNAAKMRKAAVLLQQPDAETIAKLLHRAPRQCEILAQLAKAPKHTLFLTELGKGAASSIKGLEARRLVKLVEKQVRRDPEADGLTELLPTTDFLLSDEQQTALDAILAAMPEGGENLPESAPQAILLHGVTGSGKTEIYLQAARHALRRGKSILILVPEISLTPQTVRRFRARFADVQDQVAVLHSHLSEGERYDEWHRIKDGKSKIVIGARSAVFAPLTNLGLIIVDEEHENSYKQDKVPRYHGRDIAVLRGHMEKALVVLGSATPSLESWHNVQREKYRLLRLTKRVDNQSLPLIRVVDMRLESRKQKSRDTFLSDRLRHSIEDRLQKDEQVILFLNRRGFARSLQCPACGTVCECPHCSLALTYHRTEERLICHICGYKSIVPKRCPECHDPAILLQGFGTQKVESVFRKVFPQARIARIDTDVMQRKHALRNVLNDFRSRKIDLLIGTQMIAKGLHFPNVTLVGILNADIGLHVPDFRAGERVFQLLTQVAGRAGRGAHKGEVIVQTFTPHSPSIQFARHHDYDGFAKQELEIRKQFHFPPYTHCALITSRSTHERRAEFTLQTIHRQLKEKLPPGIQLGTPLASPLVKAHSQYRFQLMLRSVRPRQLTKYVHSVLGSLTVPEDVTVVFDMDAISFT